MCIIYYVGEILSREFDDLTEISHEFLKQSELQEWKEWKIKINECASSVNIQITHIAIKINHNNDTQRNHHYDQLNENCTTTYEKVYTYNIKDNDETIIYLNRKKKKM